MRKVVTTE